MTSSRGAYGLRILGLAGAAEWMQPLSASAPALRVEVEATADVDERESRVDGDAADLRLLGGGRLRMRRGDRAARFRFADTPPDEDLLHPYLAPAAALEQLWSGREALHAGAFAAGAGAVLLLAGKEGGKSTTLAWLAAECAVQVLADDLAVIADGSVLAGPRCLDLRGGSVLPADGLVVRGDRTRVTLARAPAQAPLAAAVVLRWGERVALEPVAPGDRLALLLPERMYSNRLAPDPSTILDLAALPMLELTRPRGERGLHDGAAALVRYFS